MQHLNRLLNNQAILNYYQLGDENQLYHAEHNLNHALRVMNFCQTIATQLKLPATDIENICIAALLHDIGASKFGKNNHAERSYEIAQNYTNNSKILNAIRYHSNGHPSDYGLILTLADKLDICANRVTELGKTIPGVRQFIHFISLTPEIKDNFLYIKITSDKQIDWQELNDYYFIKKIFHAVQNFSTFFQLKYKVLIDNKEWKY